MLPMLVEAAPAKVNLYLRVLGRRADGYHLLDSLVVFAAMGDTLQAAPAEALSLEIAGPFAAALAGGAENLVLRAGRALAAAAGVAPRGRLLLTKRLPVASGIGGGSTDAAAALRLLSRLWRLDLPAARRAALAASLGADVPVCLAGRPTRMGGVGEVLASPPALPRCGLVLANPGAAVSTAAVFRARAGRPFAAAAELPPGWTDAAAMARDLAAIGNDLQAPALEVCPAIAGMLAALRRLPGCLLAQMSGSGATCFALFADPMAAERSAASLDVPGWWTWGGALAP